MTTTTNNNDNFGDEQATESMLDRFDSLCVSFGDIDCMTSLVSVTNQGQNADPYSKQDKEQHRQEEQPVCYLELQEYSKALAAQLVRRFRPDYVLVDCQQQGIPEAVAVLACMRLRLPFVPVSVQDLHSGGRLDSIVQTLRGEVEKPKAGAADISSSTNSPKIVAVTCCENDQDPLLAVFQRADVHQILFLDPQGNLREALDVPQYQSSERGTHLDAASQVDYGNRDDDNLYVLFTSGTSGKKPKAVVGSHESTRCRIDWFLQTFPPSRRICRRSKLTFVDGVTELLSGLLSFESLLVCPCSTILQNQGIASILLTGEFSAECTQVTMLPSQLQQLLLVLEDNYQHHKVDDNSNMIETPIVHLERVIVSGEACLVQVLGAFRRLLPSAELINLYGQTETTGDVTCAVLTDMTHPIVRGIVSVGKPILGCISIHNDNDSNELIVRGNLSNGYWRGNKNEKQWVDFATGDVGFQDASGNWFIQGRKDDIVKIDGILTNPSEVEAALNDTFGNKIQIAVSIIKGAVYALVNQPIEFSRQSMHAKGVPWHLIPREVFKVNQIPTSTTSGAGKVDQNCVREMIEARLISREQNGNTRKPNEKWDLNGALTEVLQYSGKIVESCSFVELGGDSALAVGLLYHLRISGLLSPTSNLSAVDIVQSRTIADLREMLGGNGAPRKRVKRSDTVSTIIRPFTVPSLKKYSKHHSAVDLRACVDAPPIVYNGSIYAACQGGIIVSVKENKVLAVYDLVQHGTNWMVQAGMVILGDTLVVCAYHRAASEGLVVGLSLDLGKIIWEVQMDEPAKVGPTIVNGLLWIPLETKFALVSPESANQIRYIPGNSKCKVLSNGKDGPAYISNKDWTADFSIIHLDANCKILSRQQHEDTFWNPCLENFVALGDNRFVVTDRCGYLYIVTLEGADIKTQGTRLSESFLSAPLVVKDTIIVGGNDGILRCVLIANIEHGVWTIDVGACILAAPLSLNSSIIVCTTAGDVILIQDGKIVFQYQINGEIWSDPVVVSDEQVAFGARDSRLHLLYLKEDTSRS